MSVFRPEAMDYIDSYVSGTPAERAQAFDEQPHVARYLDQVRRLAGR